MKYNPDILALFRKAYERDKAAYIKKWLVRWEYQDKKQTRYEGNLPQDFYEYTGPKDLEQWFEWQFSAHRPDYFDKPETHEWEGRSMAFDQALFAAHELNFPKEEVYRSVIGRNNVQDYRLAHMYEVPARYQPKRVLDFGAGYGRQANLWSQMSDPDLIFVGMDAIPKSYCLQHLYYSQIDREIFEYAESPDGFAISESKPGLYHLPTWRTDLLPSGFFDMILCVQVLPELNGDLVRHMIEVFRRVLKPGGALYLRDHDEAWKPGYKFNLNDYLPDHGFVLEFRPHIIDKVDLMGVPRIWRKIDERVIKSQERSREDKIQQLIYEVDAMTNGVLRKAYKKYIQKS